MPLTANRPKPMVLIGGEPAIAYGLRWLRRNGVEQVAINLSHQPQVVKDYVADGARFGLNVRYSFEPVLLGTAGALYPLRDFFSGSGPFVVLYGDVLTDLDLAPMLSLHERLGADLTIAVTPTTDPTRAGIVGFEQDGRVTRFVEKPPADEVFSTWENGGVYISSDRVLDWIAPTGPQDFGHDVIPTLLKAGRPVAAHVSGARFVEFGTPERLDAAEGFAISFEGTRGRA